MRVYHFLETEFALDDVKRERIKIAEIEDLNDPFELWCLAQGDKEIRRAMHEYKTTMHRRFGVLCFCKGWRNPLLWSHYGDKHRGMRLGFDIADNSVKPVEYVTERVVMPLPNTEPLENISNRLISTKYIGWQYEDEVRSWVALDSRDPEAPFYFCKFDDNLHLKEIIVGPRCTIFEHEINKALGDRTSGPNIIKSRLAFNSFEVVENRQGFEK